MDYAVLDDNMDPDGWAAVFSQDLAAPRSNTLGWMLQYDVVLFKSCFPTPNISDDETLANY